MIHTAAKQVEIPSLDLLSFLFDSPDCGAKEDTVVHCEAADPENAITKAEARVLTKKIAYILRHKYGVGRDGPSKDVVLCMCSGNLLLPIVFYGVIAAGGVYSGAGATSTAAELARQAKHGSSNLIFCTEDTKNAAMEAAKECEISLDRVIEVGGSRERSLTSVDGDGVNLLDGADALDWPRITDQDELDNSLICLLYSSGTTGLPKGVKLSHTNMVSESFVPSSVWKEGVSERAKATGVPFELRALAHLPASHIAGLQNYFINGFWLGGPTYWMPSFWWPDFIKYNQKFRITFMLSVPAVYLQIAKSKEVTDHFDALEVAVCGAAPLGKDLQRDASAKLGKGDTFITQTWGLTETTSNFTGLVPGTIDTTGSVSSLLPNMSARIIDDDGNDVEGENSGEILVKGPVVTKGYYNNDEATEHSFTDGWFITGDVGLVKDGLLYIVDRKKELIKFNGLQVAPAELEALLISHSYILDAAVIGVARSGTEVPRAFVVLDKDKKLTEEEVQDFVKQNAADHKQLRGGVFFIAKVPRTASGKILRKELRAPKKKREEVAM